MSRPEQSCTDLAGVSPVQVSIGAPGSRPQFRGVILGTSAGRQEPSVRREQSSGPQLKVNAAASSDYQPKGVREGRADHVTAKAIDNSQRRPEWEWTSPGYGRWHAMKGMCGTGETLLDSRKAKTMGIRPKAEVSGSREGVRGVRSTEEGGQEKPLEGRDPASVVVAKGKREGMPGFAMRTEANNPVAQSARTLLQPMLDRQVVHWAMHAAAGRPSVSRVLENCKHGLNGRIRRPESRFAATGA